MTEENRRLTEVILRERGRLGSFIRQRVPDPGEAEDILQDVFFAFIEACRLPTPIEQAGAWLFRVARNRIIDRFRKKREATLSDIGGAPDPEDDDSWLEQVLPDPDSGPEAAYQRHLLLEALASALDELPVGQREVFIAHELDGLSFRELSEASGVKVNTLLGWKRQAVLHLRRRLQVFYDESSR